MKYMLLVIAWSTVVSTTLEAAPKHKMTGSHYVNMGSSFAAGSGITPNKPDSVKRCKQSSDNYASILAKKLDLTLDDRSCAGAKSIHLLEAWGELAPQINAIKPDTKVVTITVGGNDLNYVRNLYALSCSEEEGLVIGGKHIPCFPEVSAEKSAYIQLEKNLRETIRKISVKAPQASVIFIQYVTLVPARLCAATSLTEQEARRMRRIAERLSSITADVAKDSGAMLLNSDALSIERTPCDQEPWSIGSTVTPNNSNGMPWHPNKQANHAIAEKLREMLALQN
ncbi:MAG: SGNH/GDSL hydrolase family protein [Agarilytica sp.]